MPKGIKKEKIYKGKALKAYEKVQKLENELKIARANLKELYKEQIKEEKAAEKKARKKAAIAAKKEMDEKNRELLKAFENSGKSHDEILDLLKNNNGDIKNHNS